MTRLPVFTALSHTLPICYTGFFASSLSLSLALDPALEGFWAAVVVFSPPRVVCWATCRLGLAIWFSASHCLTAYQGLPFYVRGRMPKLGLSQGPLFLNEKLRLKYTSRCMILIRANWCQSVWTSATCSACTGFLVGQSAELVVSWCRALFYSFYSTVHGTHDSGAWTSAHSKICLPHDQCSRLLATSDWMTPCTTSLLQILTPSVFLNTFLSDSVPDTAVTFPGDKTHVFVADRHSQRLASWSVAIVTVLVHTPGHT